MVFKVRSQLPKHTGGFWTERKADSAAAARARLHGRLLPLTI